MKLRNFILLIITVLVTTACNFVLDVGLEGATTVQPTAIVPSPSVAAPTNTSTLPPPSPEPPTNTPSPTALPGAVTVPLAKLGTSIPWLPSTDISTLPVVHYVGFKTTKPPFDNPLVRQAFAYAIDREVLVEMAKQWMAKNPTPATTLTPPYALGRDLFGEVGLNFYPFRAYDLLNQAGYADRSKFPSVTFIVLAGTKNAPYARFNMAKAMADMWFTYLRVKVEVQYVSGFASYGELLKSNPPALFWVGWVEENDPDGFLSDIFHSGSGANYGGFINSEFDSLVDRAAASHDPAERQALYIQAERLLCETEAALIPLFHDGGN